MDTFVVLGRNGWTDAEAVRAAVERSCAESERMLEDIHCVRSYVLVERDGSVGTVSVFAARSPEAIRRNAAASGFPVDEIVRVAGTVVVLPDPLSTVAEVS